MKKEFKVLGGRVILNGLVIREFIYNKDAQEYADRMNLLFSN